MKPGASEFICFLPAEVLADICGSSVIALRTFGFVVGVGTLFRMARLLTPILLPLMGHNWMFFLVMALIVHITVRFVTVRNVSIRIWVIYHFNSIVFALPPLLLMSEHIGSTGRQCAHITSL
jgi:hypothetical protein